ncbi:hypothetical protein EWB00_004636 [Schistosoma japonicum]|uniref:Uncharacterized protein n=1 Tax=Schistosoma japonicum TaxID=6182 RepID=C1LHB9_SCHJA|nr:hypothetical protein EWB00_004636 [Schistosoma japonicum]CAX69877.1 hypothetical protein [Schistosoma japonicum]CAX74097.1 hypothetical protein [Schistosoma japonicum]
MSGRRSHRKPSVSKAIKKRNKAMIERSLALLNNDVLTFRKELKHHSQSSKEAKESQGCTNQIVTVVAESHPENQIEDAINEFALMKCP